jgi:hypothetical protein
MNRIFPATCLASVMLLNHLCFAVDLQFLATQDDIGGTFFPTYSYPQNSIVPWRTDSEANFYSKSDIIGQRYYGQDGWALFGTQFSFPNANPPGVADAFINPEVGNPNFPNLINLPNFITQNQIFATRIAAGWSYALIDDPRLQAGFRKWTFDGENYPNPVGGEDSNITGVVPYVKLGVLDGRDIITDANPVVEPAARWGFQVGANVPSHFRVGVMTDGLDGVQFAPGEVFLTHLVNQEPVATIGSGTLTPNRYVDMHFFDIVNAQPGDQFLFSAMATPTGSTAAVAGFSFDIIVPFVPSGADFDGDGDVDGRDFLIWQRGGSPDPRSAGDLADWQANYGVAPITGASTAVPEPASVCMLLAGSIAVLVRRFHLTARTANNC